MRPSEQFPEPAPVPAPGSDSQGCSRSAPAGRLGGGRRAVAMQASSGRPGISGAPRGPEAAMARRIWPSGRSRSAGRAVRQRRCGFQGEVLQWESCAFQIPPFIVNFFRKVVPVPRCGIELEQFLQINDKKLRGVVLC